jgi:dimethylargininase
MSIALTRPVSGVMNRCELSHLARAPIDVALARRQHEHYERTLASCGYTIASLPPADDQPDAVFVEDILVVVDGLAIVTRPGAESRRGEIVGLGVALPATLHQASVTAPGTLDGGDVLRVGARLFVGRSARTNDEGIRQLAAFVEPLGIGVTPIPVTACLHLKSAVTAVGDDLLLLNPAWIDPRHFAGYRTVLTDPAEPAAANALRVHERVIYSDSHVRTAERLRAAGVPLLTLDVSEVEKAEGAVTCCSVLLD